MPDDTTNLPAAAALTGSSLSALGYAPGSMPTALALYLDPALYDRVKQLAQVMSKAEGVTPKHLIAKPEACFAVVTRAVTWRLDMFAVAMATYQTPGGQIGFEGKLVHAIIENSGRLEPSAGGVRYEHYGDWSKVQGRFKMAKSQSGKDYTVPDWTDDSARAGKPDDQVKYPLAQSCGVRVIAHIRGEAAPRTMDFDLIQAQPRNSTLWATDPMTQICYTAVRRFGSLVVPSLMMGVPFDPVDNAHPERDITPNPIEMPRATDEPAAAAAPKDVDPETGEIQAGEPDQAATAAKTAPPEGAAGTPAPDATEAGQVGKGTPPVAEQMGAKASEAQRNTIIKMAKNAGFTIGQMDDVLVEKLGMGIDELPMGLVNSAITAIRNAKAPAA